MQLYKIVSTFHSIVSYQFSSVMYIHLLHLCGLQCTEMMHMFVQIAIFRWFDKVCVFGTDYLLHYGFKGNAPNHQQVEAMLPISIHYPFIDEIVQDQNSDVAISNCQVFTITNY